MVKHTYQVLKKDRSISSSGTRKIMTHSILNNGVNHMNQIMSKRLKHLLKKMKLPNRIIPIFLFVLLGTPFQIFSQAETKLDSIGCFYISIPNDWYIHKINHIDSQSGAIIFEKDTLAFFEYGRYLSDVEESYVVLPTAYRDSVIPYEGRIFYSDNPKEDHMNGKFNEFDQIHLSRGDLSFTLFISKKSCQKALLSNNMCGFSDILIRYSECNNSEVFYELERAIFLLAKK